MALGKPNWQWRWKTSCRTMIPTNCKAKNTKKGGLILKGKGPSAFQPRTELPALVINSGNRISPKRFGAAADDHSGM